MRKIFTGIAIAFGLLAMGCTEDRPASSSDEANQKKIIIVGSGTMGPMVTAIAKRFEAQHPGWIVRVEGGGSLHGISNVRKERADIGMVSRNLKNEESDLQSYPIARDGVAIVVHRSNPVSRLTKAQIAEIYTGKLTRWNQVGGKNASITVISRPLNQSSQTLFADYFHLKERALKVTQTIESNSSALKAVVDDPNAIVFISVGETERSIAEGLPLKNIAIEGVEGTVENVRNGGYPLLRPLMLVTKRFPEGVVKEFVDFALSSQVADIIKTYEFVPYLD